MKDKQTKEIIAVVAVLVVAIIIAFFFFNGCSKKFTVDFDSMGGSSVSSLKVEKDGTITKPANPTKDGYIFDGWYLNGELFDFNSKITSDLKLEARWVLADNSGISLSSSSKSLSVGDSYKVSATLNGDAKGASLVYSSSDKTIATVDDNGNIKALKEGTVTITIKTKDGKYTAELTVTVSSKDNVAVKKVAISGSRVVEVGKSIKLSATFTPKNASNKNVSWSSSDKTIATVDSNGNVKGIKPGTVKITVTSADGNKKATVTITVKEASTSDTPTIKPTDTPSEPSTPSQTDKPSETDKPTTKTYTVKFQSEGKIIKTVKVEEGKTITAKDASYTPSRSGYKFVEWRLNGKKYNFNTKVTGDITLVAEWEAIYIVEVRPIVQEGTGAIMQYEIVSVKKGNESFNDYETIYFNGNKVSKGNKPRAEYIKDGATAMINNSIKATVRVVK